jgi:hypothetical protein
MRTASLWVSGAAEHSAQHLLSLCLGAAEHGVRHLLFTPGGSRARRPAFSYFASGGECARQVHQERQFNYAALIAALAAAGGR